MNQREAFEKWWREHGLQDDGDDSQYSIAAYAWAKRAWQAAAEIEREECAKIANRQKTSSGQRIAEAIRNRT